MCIRDSCYILKDDYDTALETAKKAYDDNGNSREVIDTLALCAVLKNDDATYSSMESLLDGSCLLYTSTRQMSAGNTSR